MFESESQGTASGRYRMVLVSGELRQKNHQKSVQQALDEGSVQGWRLVSATTTTARTREPVLRRQQYGTL